MFSEELSTTHCMSANSQLIILSLNIIHSKKDLGTPMQIYLELQNSHLSLTFFKHRYFTYYSTIMLEILSTYQ